MSNELKIGDSAYYLFANWEGYKDEYPSYPIKKVEIIYIGINYYTIKYKDNGVSCGYIINNTDKSNIYLSTEEIFNKLSADISDCKAWADEAIDFYKKRKKIAEIIKDNINNAENAQLKFI